ncbi:hypothetical protein [Sinorhizobium medicae]|uniref:hypothetical protein n=1 Tax=Sinorhizobium medicae TaxID=110321 RepID=UPI001297AF9D|nr:hypothetical protein [Sinorhizobium medicae]MQX78127.1 hypothetical protein [Sinorhizobium medicae]
MKDGISTDRGRPLSPVGLAVLDALRERDDAFSCRANGSGVSGMQCLKVLTGTEYIEPEGLFGPNLLTIFTG